MIRPLPRVLLISFAGLLLSATPAGPANPPQSNPAANEPASEGRPITPAGTLLLDATTGQIAVGSLPVVFVRSPEASEPDGGGRYLIVVNSGFGMQFSAATNKAQQSLAVIDLEAQPAPQVIQNVYFPTPQSANVGVAFAPKPDPDHSYALYVSGGFENKIWIFRFAPGAPDPISPPSRGPATKVTAPFISVSGFATASATPRYNKDREPVYPTGLAIGPDGDTLFVANNLSDNLGIIRNLRGERRLIRVDLSDGQPGHFVYPYGVLALKSHNSQEVSKVYVSCWATASIAVVNPQHAERPPVFIPVARHPTEMIFNSAGTRLYVVNSDADSVSVIDTATDKVMEAISVRLAEKALPGGSPESLALSPDGGTLYVANAHSNAVAVVALSAAARGEAESSVNERGKQKNRDESESSRSMVRGFIPTGQYPSAVTIANGALFIGNGKGSGFGSSSVIGNITGRAPKLPNDRFPAGTGTQQQGGEYDVALVAGTISMVTPPDAQALANYTEQVMRNDGLLGPIKTQLFPGASPIKHVIYIIKENRTYDQVFGDIKESGDGTPADGDSRLAIFGLGAAARRPGGPAQSISPNHHALALRFGLLDRFFVNSEASPDGHQWADAAFSSDYVDKAYRWNYSDRGRAYDFEGYDRLPEIGFMKDQPPTLPVPATANDIANYMKRFVPFLNGARDVGEPDTLFLWDNAARSGVSFRDYGEAVMSISQGEVDAFNANEEQKYPDVTPTAIVFSQKKGLQDHLNLAYRNFDLHTPDSMTIDSYRAAKSGGGHADPLISQSNADPRFRGYSRIAVWLEEFRSFAAALQKGEGDSFPALNFVYLPNDHTNAMKAHMPTPQFYVADNDYALGLLVQEVSSSPYWKDTAILVVEDDAQNGPDHVDAHRSPALVISAYNRPGALVHEYHSTVSLVRTLELLAGLPPMNQLDASATPMDIFRAEPDLSPYHALMPDVALDNLEVRKTREEETARMIRRSEQQDLSAADLADPQTLNQIIWFSVRGPNSRMPAPARLPVYDALRTRDRDDAASELALSRLLKHLLARR